VSKKYLCKQCKRTTTAATATTATAALPATMAIAKKDEEEKTRNRTQMQILATSRQKKCVSCFLTGGKQK